MKKISMKNVENKFYIFWFSDSEIKNKFTEMLTHSKIDYESYPYDRSIVVFDLKQSIPLNWITEIDIQTKSFFVETKKDETGKEVKVLSKY